MSWLPAIGLLLLLLCALAAAVLGLSAYAARQCAKAMQVLTKQLEAVPAPPPSPARFDMR